MTGTSPVDVAVVLEELHRRLDHTVRRTDSHSTFGEHLTHVPHIVCSSGLKMSVQASAFHYCVPRESEGPWSAVEVFLQPQHHHFHVHSET
jgi:hypothetical protein